MSVFVAPAPKSPETLTYLELRKAVGFIAVALPFAVALPRLVLKHSLEGSIQRVLLHQFERSLRRQPLRHCDVPALLSRL